MSTTTDSIILEIKVKDDGTVVLGEVNKKIKRFAQNVKTQFKGIKDKFGDVFKSIIKKIGILVGTTALITQVGGAFRSITADAYSFNREYTQVLTLVDRSQVSFNGLQDTILGLGGPLGDVQNLTKGTYQMISSGQAPAVALREIGAAAKFAQGGQAALADTVSLGTGFLNQYGEAAKGLTHIYDVMWQVIKDGVTNAKQLAHGMGRIIPISYETGLTIEELGGSMAVMTQISQNTNESITAMKGIMGSIIKPTKEAAAEAERLGINFSVAGVKSMGFAAWLQDVMEKAKAGGGDLSKLWSQLEALNGVFQLTRDNMQAFTTQMEKMGSVAGNTEENFKKWQESFQGAWESLRNEVQAVAIKEILPIMKELAQYMRDNSEKIVEFTRSFVRGIGDLVKTLLKLKDTAITVGKLMLMNFAIKKFTPFFTGMNAGFGNMLDYYKILKLEGNSTFTSINGAIKTHMGKIGGLTTLLKKIPTSIKISIALLGAELVGKWLADFFKNYGDKIDQLNAKEQYEYERKYFPDEVARWQQQIRNFRNYSEEYEKIAREVHEKAMKWRVDPRNMTWSFNDPRGDVNGNVPATDYETMHYKMGQLSSNPAWKEFQAKILETTHYFDDYRRGIADILSDYDKYKEKILANAGHITFWREKLEALSEKTTPQFKERIKQIISELVIKNEKMEVATATAAAYSEKMEELAGSMGVLTEKGLLQQSQKINDLLKLYKDYKGQISGNFETTHQWITTLEKLTKTALPDEKKKLGEVVAELKAKEFAQKAVISSLMMMTGIIPPAAMQWKKLTDEQKKQIAAEEDLAKKIGIVTHKMQRELSESIQTAINLHDKYNDSIYGDISAMAEMRDVLERLSEDALPGEREELNKRVYQLDRNIAKTKEFIVQALQMNGVVHGNSGLMAMILEELELVPETTEGANKELGEFAATLGNVVTMGNSSINTLRDMGMISEAFASKLTGLTNGLGAITSGLEMLNSGKKGAEGFISTLAGGLSTVAGFFSATSSVLGLLFGDGPDWDKAAAGKLQGIATATDSMRERLAELAEQLGSTAKAFRQLLGEFISDAVISSKYQFDQWASQVHELADSIMGGIKSYSTRDRGSRQTGNWSRDPKKNDEKESGTSWRDEIENFGNAFEALIRKAEDLGLHGTESMLSIIRIARNAFEEEGIKITNVFEYISEHLGTAKEGLSLYLSSFLDTGDLRKQIAEVQDEMGGLKGSKLIGKQKELEALQLSLDGNISAIYNNWGFIETNVLALVTAYQGQGKGILEIAELMKDEFTNLSKIAKDNGIEITGGLKEMLDLTDFVNQHEDIAKRIEGTQKMLQGLGNTAYLTEGDFSNFSNQVISQFNEIISLTGDQTLALRLIGPSFLDLEKYADSYGFAIDDATKSLIAQAKEAGVLGETQKTQSEIMQEGFSAVCASLDRIALGLGVEIPGALETFAGAATRSIKNVDDITARWSGQLNGIPGQFGDLENVVTHFDDHYTEKFTGNSVVNTTQEWIEKLEGAEGYFSVLTETVSMFDGEYTKFTRSISEETQETWKSALGGILENIGHWNDAITEVQAQMLTASDEALPILQMKYDRAMQMMEYDTQRFNSMLLELQDTFGITIPDELDTLQGKFDYVMQQMANSTETYFLGPDGVLRNLLDTLSYIGTQSYMSYGSQFGIYTEEEKQQMTVDFYGFVELWNQNRGDIMGSQDNMQAFVNALQNLTVTDDAKGAYDTFMTSLLTYFAPPSGSGYTWDNNTWIKTQGNENNYGLYSNQEKQDMTDTFHWMEGLWNSSQDDILSTQQTLNAFIRDLEGLVVQDGVLSSWQAFLNKLQGYTWNDESGTWQAPVSAATGARFIVPSGFSDTTPGRGFPMEVHSGELVQVFTPGETRQLMSWSRSQESVFDVYGHRESEMPEMPDINLVLPELPAHAQEPQKKEISLNIKLEIGDFEITVNNKNSGNASEINDEELAEKFKEMMGDNFRDLAVTVAAEVERRLNG